MPPGLAFRSRTSAPQAGRPTSREQLNQRWDMLRDRLSSHRRLAAAGLAGLAVLVAWPALGSRSTGSEILVAAHDLPAGSRLTDQDVRAARLPTDAVPAHALTPGVIVSGRIPTGPVRAGEPLTDVRLLGPALLDELSRQDGRVLVAAPVRIGDGGAAGLLQTGDTIDILAAASFAGESAGVPGAEPENAGAAGPARLVAVAVRVLAVPPAEGTDPTGGALIVVAVPPATAADVASAASTSRLSVTVRGAPANPAPAGNPGP